MNVTSSPSRTVGARHRDALIARCAAQRLTLANDAHALLPPLSPSHLRRRLGARLKVPLILAGAGLALLMVRRPNKLIPLLIAGASLWKSASAFAPVVRGFTVHSGSKTPKLKVAVAAAAAVAAAGDLLRPGSGRDR